MSKSKTISLNEAAEELGISNSHLYKMLNSDAIPGAKKIGERWIVDRTVFKIWIYMGNDWNNCYLPIIKLTELLCNNEGA